MTYSRMTNEEVRQEDRARFRALSTIGREFGLSAEVVDAAWQAGEDAEKFRQDHEARARRRLERAAAVAVTPLPAGETLTGEAATVAVLVSAGRRDLAERRADSAELTRDVRSRALRARSPRDLFGAVCGVRFGSGFDVGAMFADLLSDTEDSRFSGDTAVGLRPATALGAATRDGMQMILMDDWNRSGQFWRAASLIVPLPNFRPHRLWINRSGAVQSEPLPENQTPRLDLEGAESWPQVDVEVEEYAEKLCLSRKRATNSGFAELASHISAATATWNDRLDQLTAAQLDEAPEVSGMLDMGVLADAVSAVNLQRIDGLPLGSDGGMAVALAGEGSRRDVLAAQYSSPSADGDRQALIERIAYSASVDGTKAFVRHGRFAPVVLAVLAGPEFMPKIAYGENAGVKDPAGQVARLAVNVRADFALPKLLKVGLTGIGAVRLTIT